jgi:hypothetical protein
MSVRVSGTTPESEREALAYRADLTRAYLDALDKAGVPLELAYQLVRDWHSARLAGQRGAQGYSVELPVPKLPNE